jgi:hypothetical protein
MYVGVQEEGKDLGRKRQEPNGDDKEDLKINAADRSDDPDR